MRALERLESSILEKTASGHQLPVPSTLANMKGVNKVTEQGDASDPLLQVSPLKIYLDTTRRSYLL